MTFPDSVIEPVAHQIYQRRKGTNITGSALSDWYQAIDYLKRENKFAVEIQIRGKK